MPGRWSPRQSLGDAPARAWLAIALVTVAIVLALTIWFGRIASSREPTEVRVQAQRADVQGRVESTGDKSRGFAFAGWSSVSTTITGRTGAASLQLCSEQSNAPVPSRAALVKVESSSSVSF